jgi:probable rRNA maturation factor
MILLDPDLDAGSSPQAKLPKRLRGVSQSAGLRGQPIPSRQTLARFLREAQVAVKLRGHVSVLLTTDAVIRRLNRQFRGKNKATDVLSFPAASPSPMKVAGDLAISVPTARGQAADRGHSLAIEIKVLMLHGLLHLAGYDHETDTGDMDRREQELRAALRLPHGLIERTLHGTVNSRASLLPQVHRGKSADPRPARGARR